MEAPECEGGLVMQKVYDIRRDCNRRYAVGYQAPGQPWRAIYSGLGRGDAVRILERLAHAGWRVRIRASRKVA